MTGLSDPAFEKLIKLMQLTGSCSDNELLSAVRMANTLLKTAGYNWEDLLRGKVVTFPDNTPDLTPPPASVRFDNPLEINPYFDQILSRKLSPKFEGFVTSVHEWWKQKGFLTKAQYDAIKRAASR